MENYDPTIANRYNIKLGGLKKLVPNLCKKKLTTLFTTRIYSYTNH